MPPRRTAVLLGIANAFTAALVVFGVFVALPTRWLPVDSAAAVLVAIQVASAVGLFVGASWAAGVAKTAGAIALGLGLLAVTALAMTASWLSGVYGPVGRGGSIVLALVAALVLPYLVVLPVVQLLFLRTPPRNRPVTPEPT